MSAYSAGMQSPSTREIVEHCKRIVFFGGAAARNMQVNPGGIGYHDAQAHFGALAEAGIDIVNIGPIRDDVLASVAPRWIRRADPTAMSPSCSA